MRIAPARRAARGGLHRHSVRARLGGKHGEALYARGYGLRGSQRFY
jgi:hypothetical protein